MMRQPISYFYSDTITIVAGNFFTSGTRTLGISRSKFYVQKIICTVINFDVSTNQNYSGVSKVIIENISASNLYSTQPPGLDGGFKINPEINFQNSFYGELNFVIQTGDEPRLAISTRINNTSLSAVDSQITICFVGYIEY